MIRKIGRRPLRVAEAVREIVAPFLTSEARDPRIGLVTVTAVRVTPDLRRAVVGVAIHGDAATKAGSLKALARAAVAVRREIAHQLPLKVTPEVVFELDEVVERAARIEGLLAELKRGGEPGA